ncbi:hypothetical protein PG984_005460 [Apiospora sp. TS-2023a]
MGGEEPLRANAQMLDHALTRRCNIGLPARVEPEKSGPGRGVCPVVRPWLLGRRLLGHASKLLAHQNASTHCIGGFPDPCADQARRSRTKILAAPPGMPGPGPALMPGGLDSSASLCTTRERPGGGGSTTSE